MLDEDDRIKRLTDEIAAMKKTLREKEVELTNLITECPKVCEETFKISKNDVVRYSRQMIIPQIGIQGQIKLRQLSVLIVGVGGLGCPAALYLAGAGVGNLGLVDYDVVEENNLHRQLLHNEDNLGIPKVTSAAINLKKVNQFVAVKQYKTLLNSNNALELVREYDVVVDASDNAATRYLINDACVLAGRPLVSGSALQLEGQLTVYNHAGGPCYRCLYPQPPPPDMVTNCSDAGVLGPVPGVIGTLQALEVIKIALGFKDVLSAKLLLFDGENSSFRTIHLRKKNSNCPVCGINPTVTQLIDYEQFCGSSANDKEKNLSLLSETERISPKSLQNLLLSDSRCVVVDVRQEAEFMMCSIPGSVNIPLASLLKSTEHLQSLLADKAEADAVPSLCMVCRRGNDSQLAVRKLQPLLKNWFLKPAQLVDLQGGLHSWASVVDPNFPIY